MSLHSTLERQHHISYRPTPAKSSAVFKVQPLAYLSSRHPGQLGEEMIYKLIIITQGSYEYQLGRKSTSLVAGMVGFISPHDHFELPSPEDAEGFLLFFTQDFVQSTVPSNVMVEAFHFGLSNNIAQVNLPPNEHQFLADITSRLYLEYSEKRSGEMMTSLFQIFLLQINRALSDSRLVLKGKCYLHAKKFIGLLDKYFMTHKMPGDYADLMAVTPAYLNNVVKETLGNTTSYFINQRIFAEAKRLMTYDELNMKEVADRLGFLDSSHFSKFFKRIAGRKFSDFRRSCNQ